MGQTLTTGRWIFWVGAAAIFLVLLWLLSDILLPFVVGMVVSLGRLCHFGGHLQSDGRTACCLSSWLMTGCYGSDLDRSRRSSKFRGKAIVKIFWVYSRLYIQLKFIRPYHTKT